MILTELNLSYEEMRSLVISVIKEQHFSQYADIKNGVVQKLISGDYIQDSEPKNICCIPNCKELNPVDNDKVNQIVWDLIIERILNIGLVNENDSWPFLRLTDYGKKQLNIL